MTAVPVLKLLAMRGPASRFGDDFGGAYCKSLIVQSKLTIRVGDPAAGAVTAISRALVRASGTRLGDADL